MPTYRFVCKECGKPYSHYLTFTEYDDINKKEKIILRCPVCKKETEQQRKMSIPVIKYNTDGFYNTDSTADDLDDFID